MWESMLKYICACAGAGETEEREGRWKGRVRVVTTEAGIKREKDGETKRPEEQTDQIGGRNNVTECEFCVSVIKERAI